MKRLAIAIALTACGGGKKPDPATAGSGSGTVLYAKQLSVSWGITQNPTKADLFLQTTDETGKQLSYSVGTYDGTCKTITPAAEMKALTGVSCTSGIELDAVIQGDEIVVLKGKGGDPMAREEVTRIGAPPGAKIEAGS